MKLRGGAPLLPAQVHGARGLLDAGLYAGVNPRVVVSVRGEKRSTPTQRNTSAPFWGGAAGADGACWDVFCDDPTAVVHVVVHDVEGTGGYFVGQWITTVKHLVLAPTFNRHNECAVLRPRECGGGYGVRGWSETRLATISLSARRPKPFSRRSP